jgi:hypothetical protein
MPDKITKNITRQLMKAASPEQVKKAGKVLRSAHDRAHAILSGEVKEKVKRSRTSVKTSVPEERPKSFFDTPRTPIPALEKPDIEKPRLASKIESDVFDSVVHQPPKARVDWASKNTETWPRLAVMFGDNPLRTKMMTSELKKEPDRQRSVILGLIAKHGSDLHRSELKKHHDPYVRKMAGELREDRAFVMGLIKEAAVKGRKL